MASTRTFPLISLPQSTKKIQPLKPKKLSFQRPEEELTHQHVSVSSLDTSLSSSSYASILDSCKCPYLGKQIHGHAFRTGFHRDVFAETKLLQMYARCGCFEYADLLFDEMPARSLYAWTAILGVYVDSGFFDEAFTLFLEFYCEDHVLDFFIFPVVFKICSGIGSPGLARQLHGTVAKSRFVENIYVCNALIDMYGKCGLLNNAKRVFAATQRRDRVTWNSILTACASNGMVFEALDFMDRMGSDESSSSSKPNVVSWSAVLGGFSRNSHDEEAISMLFRMKLKGIEPNARTLASILPSCARLQRIRLGREIHGYIMRNGFMLNPFLVNGLVDMYRRCGDMRNASTVFSSFSLKNAASCNTMIVGYCADGNVSEAKELFGHMESKDVISWNAIISGHVDNCLYDSAMGLFLELLEEGIHPDSFTLGSILTACSDGESLRRGKEIHSRAIKSGLQSNPFVGGALVELYSRSRDFSAAQRAFDEVAERDISTWNALISNYSRSGQTEEITKLLQKMREDGVDSNVYTWNGILAGHVENNHLDSAMRLFAEMQDSNSRPDIYTVGIILQACSRSGMVQRGKQVHAHSVRHGYDSDAYIGAAIVDMYAKCGSSRLALQSYKKISKPDLVSHNAMLSAYALHGHGEEGIAFFRRILEEGFRPDYVTFLSALSSCVHVGSFQTGYEFLDMMGFFNVKPTLKHYTCIVDLLSRANRLNEAYEFTKRLSVEPDSVLWGALLGGCVIHGDVELGEIAAKRLIELEPDNTANYVLLSNLYGSAKKWEDLAKLRQSMKGRGMQKSPGCSWIEYKDDVHAFLASDKSHERSKEIYDTLNNLTMHMKAMRTTSLGLTSNKGSVINIKDMKCEVQKGNQISTGQGTRELGELECEVHRVSFQGRE